VSVSATRPVRLVGVPGHGAPSSRRPGRQGTLALELVPGRLEPPLPPLLEEQDDDLVLPGGTVTLPDPERWAGMIGQAVVEILAGRRPPAQVVRWLDSTVYERVRRSADALKARDGARQAGVPVRVRRVRLGPVVDGRVEAVVVVDDAVRCRALALRLDAIDGRWLCTALDVV
jgi:hypothetical protein